MYPFKIGHNHAAAVCQNVRNNQYAVLTQNNVGFRSSRAVCAFNHDFRADFACIFGSQLIFQCTRGEYVHIQSQKFGIADFFTVAGFIGDETFGLEFFNDCFHIQAVFVVDGNVNSRYGNDFRTGFVCIVTGVVAHITETLNGVSGTFHVFAQFFQSLDGGEVYAVTGGFGARQGTAKLNRFAGKHARCRMFHDVFIGINHPRHDFAVGVHIRGGNVDFLADQRRNGFGISAGDAFQFCFGIVTRIQSNTAFTAAVRNTGYTAFDGHPNRQCFDFVQIYIGMETHAAFVRADGVIVLGTVTGEIFYCTVVEFDREVHFQNTLRLFQDFKYCRVGIQAIAGNFHLFLCNFKRIQCFFNSRCGHVFFLFIHMIRREPYLLLYTKTGKNVIACSR